MAFASGTTIAQDEDASVRLRQGCGGTSPFERVTMRITSFAAILLATVLLTSNAYAQEARASVQGFGGVGVGSFTTPNTNFGGVITGDLTPNVQFIGEAGRLSNILPSTTQMLFDLSPV